MPSEAVQCSSCRNWRRDVHLLIDTYRKLAIAQLAAFTIGGTLAALVLITGARQPTARTPTPPFDPSFRDFAIKIEGGKIVNDAHEKKEVGGEFSFGRFVTTPYFAFGAFLVVVVVVVYVFTQGRAVRTRRRIHELTKGLWKRPWWTH